MFASKHWQTITHCSHHLRIALKHDFVAIERRRVGTHLLGEDVYDRLASDEALTTEHPRTH